MYESIKEILEGPLERRVNVKGRVEKVLLGEFNFPLSRFLLFSKEREKHKGRSETETKTNDAWFPFFFRSQEAAFRILQSLRHH